MIKRLLGLVQKKGQGLHQAALLLGVFSLISQLIGLARDRLLASVIGPSQTLDVYYAAFRIPDFIYLSVASLASITVLMPFLIQHMDEKGKESARDFLSSVLSGFFLLLVFVSVIVFFFMPQISRMIAPGFSDFQLHELVNISRIMLLSPILLGISNMLGTVTQLLRKFFIFSLSPILYNLGIVFGIIFLYPKMGVVGLAIGVVAGAVLHLLVQLPTIIKSGFAPRLSYRLQHSTLKQVVGLSLPRTLGLSMNNIALLVIVAIGTTLGAGSISIFNFSLDLETTPVGIIGISYAIASFPFLAETFARQEKEKWRDCILDAIKQIIFWSLPLTSLFIILRAQIVRVTLGSGAFSWTDTRLTAACFALFTIGLIGQNMILVSVRAFYSAHDTKKPLYINTVCSIFIVVLAFALVRFFQDVTSFRLFVESLLRVPDVPQAAVLMLPLAYSIGTLINAWLHWIDLRKNYIQGPTGVGRVFWESLMASLVIGIVSYIVLNLLIGLNTMRTFWGILGQGTLAGFAGCAVGVLVLYLIGNKQLLELIFALRHKFWKVDLVEPYKTE